MGGVSKVSVTGSSEGDGIFTIGKGKVAVSGGRTTSTTGPKKNKKVEQPGKGSSDLETASSLSSKSTKSKK